MPLAALVVALGSAVPAFASTPPIQAAASSGQVTGPAATISDSGAINGQAVQFAAQAVTSPAGFTHPGILDSLAQLDYVKSKIAAGAQPWTDMFNRMKASSLAASTYTPAPTVALDCGTNNAGCQKEESDGRAAYTNALLWYYTGNPAYGQKAVSILNAWSTTQTYATTYTQNYLDAAWFAEMYPRAAEIIRYTYTPASGQPAFNLSAFTNLLVNVWQPLLGPSTSQMQSSNGNWDLSMTAGLVDIGIFTDNRTTFQAGLDRWRARTPAYIYLATDNSGSGLPVTPPGTYYPTTKKVQCFWLGAGAPSTTCDTTNFLLANGQTQETCRDYQHVALGLASIFDVAEAARTQGVDLYGEQRDRLVAGLEFNTAIINAQAYPANLCRGAVSTPPTPITDPTFSIGYTQFAARLGISLPNTLQSVQRIQSGRAAYATDHQMAWEELTHFDGANTCTAPTIALGVDTMTATVATAGTYRVWSRVKPAAAADTSFSIQVDGNCAMSGGGSTLPAAQWTWVDYQNGNTSSKINVTLSAGTHSLTLAGQSPSLTVDTVLLTNDPACVPVGDGSNCQPDITAPSTPTGLASTNMTPTSVTLSWADAIDNVGVDHYVVRQDGAAIATVAGTGFTDTGLDAGTPYRYTVTAVDAAGNASADSDALVVTTLAPPDTTPPSAPTGLSTSTVTETSASLTWDPASDNIAVDHYVITESGAAIGQTATTHFTDTGLDAGTTYRYTVTAVDAAGNASADSDALVVTTLAPPDTTPPSAPTGLSTSTVTETSASLTWDPASDNIAVDHYVIMKSGAAIGQTTTTHFTDTGLTAASDYSYTVVAVDAAGNSSAASDPLPVTTPDTTAPSVPTGLTASAITRTAVTLTWSAATDNIAVTAYTVRRGTTVLGSVAGTTYTDTGLDAATAYSYTVSAQDAAANTSAASVPVQVTTLAPLDTTPPSVPAGLSTSALTETGLTLAWTAATDNVGVDHYIVRRGGSAIGTAAGTTFADTGLTAGTAYTYNVIAVDAAGNQSAASTALGVTTSDTHPPTAPGAFTATATSATSVSLMWTAATDNVRVDHYSVRRGTTTLVGSQTGLTFGDTSAAASTSYTYSVVAYDAAGNASTAATATVTTPAAPDTQAPSVPGGLAVTGVTVSSVALSWNAATDNVATTGYEVYRGTTKVATTTTARTYTDVGLTASTAYSYAVLAFDAAGNRSAKSTAITGITATAPDTTAPTAPATFTVQVSALNQVTLVWAAATDNVKVTGYRLTRGGAVIATPTALTYTDASLTPATAYSYGLTALDAAGNASTAKTATVTTPLDAAPLGAGFAGAYFANATLSGPAIGRLDTGINFNWGTSAPMPGIPADNFSVRWTGKLTPTATGTYTFYTQTDDGVRLYLNDRILIDKWSAGAVSKTATATLTAGTAYNLRVEYLEVTGSAVAGLQWSGPSITKATLPASVMSSASAGLSASYFANSALTGAPTVQRLDAGVNFDWATGSPDARLPADNFSSRWTGKISAPVTGSYTFYTDSADGIRVTVNGQLVINNWTSHSLTTNSGTVSLNAGTLYSIKVEYQEISNSAVAKLSWSYGTVAKAVVGATYLRDR